MKKILSLFASIIFGSIISINMVACNDSNGKTIDFIDNTNGFDSEAAVDSIDWVSKDFYIKIEFTYGREIHDLVIEKSNTNIATMVKQFYNIPNWIVNGDIYPVKLSRLYYKFLEKTVEDPKTHKKYDIEYVIDIYELNGF